MHTESVPIAVDWRAPTADELRVLRWLLTVGAETTGADTAIAMSFLPQLDNILVAARCQCGCPSIDLKLPASSRNEGKAPSLFVSVDGLSSQGIHLDLILRCEDGALSYLEACAYRGSPDAPFSLPRDDELLASC